MKADIISYLNHLLYCSGPNNISCVIFLFSLLSSSFHMSASFRCFYDKAHTHTQTNREVMCASCHPSLFRMVVCKPFETCKRCKIAKCDSCYLCLVLIHGDTNKCNCEPWTTATPQIRRNKIKLGRYLYCRAYTAACLICN